GVPEARRLAPPRASVRSSQLGLGALPRRAAEADARHLVRAGPGAAAARGLDAHRVPARGGRGALRARWLAGGARGGHHGQLARSARGGNRHLAAARRALHRSDLPRALGYAALEAVDLLRRPLTALLSPRARFLCLRALAPFRGRPLEWALASLSIVIGVWNHLLWDSFTHNDGWIVRRVAVLSAPVSFAGYHGTLCHVLQYVTSAIGLGALALWYGRLPAPRAVAAGRGAPRSPVGPALVLVAAAAILIGGVQATRAFAQVPVMYRTIVTFLTHSLAWFAVLYLVAG